MKFLDRLPPELQADSFRLGTCVSPTCGLHIIASQNGSGPFCEIVMSPEQTRNLIRYCEDLLEDKE